MAPQSGQQPRAANGYGHRSQPPKPPNRRLRLARPPAGSPSYQADPEPDPSLPTTPTHGPRLPDTRSWCSSLRGSRSVEGYRGCGPVLRPLEGGGEGPRWEDGQGLSSVLIVTWVSCRTRRVRFLVCCCVTA